MTEEEKKKLVIEGIMHLERIIEAFYRDPETREFKDEEMRAFYIMLLNKTCSLMDEPGVWPQ